MRAKMQQILNTIKENVCHFGEICISKVKIADAAAMANLIPEGFKCYRNIYGNLAVVAALAVALKFLLFYILMEITINLLWVWLMSLILFALFFKMFRNKWTAAVLYAVLSILMFCDVTYSGFFDKYLSTNMLWAVGVVGDITNSIAEVIQPVSFFLFADVLIIFAVLYLKRRRDKLELDMFGAVVEKRASEQNVFEETAKGNMEAQVKEAENLDEVAMLEDASKTVKEYSKRKSKINKNPAIIGIVIVLIFTINIMGTPWIQSIANQEFLLYHIKDVAAMAAKGGSVENLSAWTDSYNEEKEGPLFGAAEGKNLIMIQIESLQEFVVGLEYNRQEVTPNLNKLIEGNTTYFDNFYQQTGSGNTSDAEFAANNSLMGTLLYYTYHTFPENYFHGLPKILQDEGYETAAFHAYENKDFWSRETMYPAQGIEKFYGGLAGNGDTYEMTEWMGWGLTDTYFFQQTLPFIMRLDKPFYSFVITLSNHHPYEMLEHYKFIELEDEDKDTIAGRYLQSAAYTDYALGQFIQGLKDNGLYNNSLIVIYGDHVGLTRTEETDRVMKKILNKQYDYEEMLSVPFIVHMGGSRIDIKQTISTAGGQTDILPTLAYLMGIEELNTMYVGHNLYAITEGFVAQQMFMRGGSFFTNDIAYEMSKDGVFENGRAWNIHTGETVALEGLKELSQRSYDVAQTSEYILFSDLIRIKYGNSEN